MQLFKGFIKHLILFIIGGYLYYNIEVLWRGYSHWSMFLLSGLCFLLIGYINIYYTWEMRMWKQQLIATIIITTLEFITGCIVNIWLGLDVWHYTQPFNLLGQISLGYSFLWFWLSLFAIMLDDWLRHKLFGEKFEKYKWL